MYAISTVLFPNNVFWIAEDRGCEDALEHGMTTSGVHTISPDGNNPINVYCEQGLDGGGWTVCIQIFTHAYLYMLITLLLFEL